MENGGVAPICARAIELGAPILTRDAGRYRTYFPEVEFVGAGDASCNIEEILWTYCFF